MLLPEGLPKRVRETLKGELEQIMTTKPMNPQKKAIILSLSLLIIILCGAILFVAAQEPINIVHYDSDSFEHICGKKAIDLGEQLRHLAKVDDAIVYIEPLNNEINRVFIHVQVTDDIDNSELDNISNYISQYFEELDSSQLIVSFDS